VLDLASGRGEPLLRVATRVGPGGHVLGVDVDAQAARRSCGSSTASRPRIARV